MDEFKAKLGLDNKPFLDGMAKAETGLGGLGKKIGSMINPITLLTAAFAGVVKWFAGTDTGAKALNITLTALGQTMTDIFNLDKSHGAEAVYYAKKQSDIIAGEARELFLASKMQRELNNLRISAAEETNPTLRLAALNKVKDKEAELKAFRLKSATESRDNLMGLYLLDLDNTKKKEAYYAAAIKVQDIKGSDSLRIETQITSELTQQIQRARDLEDAFTAIPPTLAEMKKEMGEITKIMTEDLGSPGPSVFSPKGFRLTDNKGKLSGKPTGGNATTAASMAAEVQKFNDETAAMIKMDDLQLRLQEALSSMRDMAIDYGAQIAEALGEALGGGDTKELGKGLLLSLANFLSQFGKMLIVAGLGIQAFADAMATGNAPLAIAAGVAMLVAAGAIKGMMSKAGSSGVTGSGGGSQASMQPQTIKVIVEGKISGKDINIASRRYVEDNG
jgi:hypothetical protein